MQTHALLSCTTQCAHTCMTITRIRHMCMCTCIWLCKHIHMQKCIYSHMHAYRYAYTHAQHVHIYNCICAHVNRWHESTPRSNTKRARLCKHAPTHTHTHMRTQQQTHPCEQQRTFLGEICSNTLRSATAACCALAHNKRPTHERAARRPYSRYAPLLHAQTAKAPAPRAQLRPNTVGSEGFVQCRSW